MSLFSVTVPLAFDGSEATPLLVFTFLRYIEDGGIRLTYDPAVVNPTFKIIENKDYPVFYDPLSPAADTSVYYQWKPGLQTYYPKEILLSW